MNRKCSDCNGSGYRIVERWSDYQKRKVKKLEECPRCDGSGKRHTCEEPGCVNRARARG